MTTAALPPVLITLPKQLLAPFVILASIHGAQVEDCQGSSGEVAVLTRPQLRFWILAAWAQVYGHRLQSTNGRGLRLVPIATAKQEAA